MGNFSQIAASKRTLKKTQKRSTSTVVDGPKVPEVDIKEVSNEVEMYFPARRIQFNVQNLDDESNLAGGFNSKITDTESG